MAKKIHQALFGLYALSSVVLVANAGPVSNTRQPEKVNDEIAHVLSHSVNVDASRIYPRQGYEALFSKRDTKWTVREGDTGNTIAAQLGIEFYQLAIMNRNVQWQFLQIGQTLNIPGDSSDDSSVYTVGAGDSGNTIAAASKITFAQLDASNKNVDWYNLQIGQTLIIPNPHLDTSQGSQAPAIDQVEENADSPATAINVGVASTVDDVEVPIRTKQISPFLTPGETLESSNEQNVSTLQVRQIRSAASSARSASASTSISAIYTVKARDTGLVIAAQHGIRFDTLSEVNPNVDWLNLQIGQVIKLSAQTTISSTTTTPLIARGTRSAPILPPPFPPNSNSPSTGAYVTYSGTVDTAEPAYPHMSTWIPFAQLWSMNSANIGTSCVFLSGSVAVNTASETIALRSTILDVSTATSVHPSFIFAMIMQESNGCVRAPTTSSWEDIQNPGLMQSFRGRASCNDDDRVQNPCPDFLIKAMVLEGVRGSRRVGIVPALRSVAKKSGMRWPLSVNATAKTDVNVSGNVQGQGANTNTQVSVEGGANVGVAGPTVKQVDAAILYYQAARVYNSGSLSDDGDLSAKTGSTRCYVSDIINRLLGWVDSPSTCSLS